MFLANGFPLNQEVPQENPDELREQQPIVVEIGKKF